MFSHLLTFHLDLTNGFQCSLMFSNGYRGYRNIVEHHEDY
nr:MAG TPA: hypothetical protein [Caudoviricetes sp.]